VLPALLLLRPVAALGGAGTDKIALHVCEAAEHGNLNISVAGGTSGSNPLSSSGESATNRECGQSSQRAPPVPRVRKEGLKGLGRPPL
jgi:hypothetical protein